MANETMTVSCRGPAPGDPKSEPDESSYMLRDKKPSPTTCRDRRHQHTWQERHRNKTFDESWAWYVVGGCAFANFLLPGMLRSFGPDVLDRFVEVHEFEFKNRSVVDYCRWIPATFHLTFFIAGSLSCLLCKLTSHRVLTFWGGLLASAGMMSSSFANSISHLYISYGVMVGFGAGLCYSAGILIVNEYFDKHRGLANGFSLAGTAIGALALPPYLEFLTFSYGYRGGILIVSGMMLNTLACSLTYKPAATAAADGAAVEQDEVTCTRPIASSTPTATSINARAVTSTAFRAATDLYYATVVSSPSPPLLKPKTTAAAAAVASSTEDEDDEDDDEVDYKCLENTRWWRWQRWRHPRFGYAPSVEFLGVSSVHAICHLAYATAVPARAAALQLAAAEAAGRLLAPTASDLLSPGGSASVYLYAAAVAVGGTVLLTGAATESDVDPFLWPSRSALYAQWSASLVVVLGLASGAAVGLEPLVAVHALGHERLAASCSATLLGKGAAQLTVDLLLRPSSAGAHWQPISPCVLYALGSVLVATAAAWTAAFLSKRHYAVKTGCSGYVRTV